MPNILLFKDNGVLEKKLNSEKLFLWAVYSSNPPEKYEGKKFALA